MSHYSDMGYVLNGSEDLGKLFDPILQGKVAGTKTYDLGHKKALRIAKVDNTYFAVVVAKSGVEKLGFCYSNENLSSGVNAVKVKQKDLKTSDFDILRVEIEDGIPFWFSCINIDTFDFSKPLASVKFAISGFADAVKVGDKPAYERMAPESYIAEFNDDPSYAIFNGVIKAFKVETNKKTGLKYYVVDADCMGLHFRLLVDYSYLKESELAVGKIISGHFWFTAMIMEDSQGENIKKKRRRKNGIQS